MNAPHPTPSAFSPLDWASSLESSLAHRLTETYPYRHWYLRDVLPPGASPALRALPFEAQHTDGVSGRRELHNATRRYFDQAANERLPACRTFANLFQSQATVGVLAEAFGADLDGTYLRIEYAADTDGFWLEPHTDLGVKKLTFLYYLSDEPGQLHLGTDIYVSADRHYSRAPFVDNSALVFVPSTSTWHGFEKRPIAGTRKSLIVNYVTADWRAREQLAFPEAPIRLK